MPSGVPTKKKLTSALLILVSGMVAPGPIFGETTTGSGILRATGTIDVDSRGVQYTSDVTAVVSVDGRFKFSLNNHWHHKDRDIVFSYDGDDFYYFMAETEDDSARSYLSTGEIPMNATQDCARDGLWYALGSARFWERNGAEGQMINLFQQPRANINAFGFTYQADLVQQEPLLPKKLTIIKDKTLDYDTMENEAARVEIDPTRLLATETELRNQWETKRQWPDKYLTIEVSWRDESYVSGGIKMPIGFSYQIFSIYNTNNPQWTVSGSLDGWEYEKGGMENYRPDISGRVRVRDSRLRSRSDTHYVASVHYWIDDETGWRSKEDPEIQRRF